MKVKCEMSKVKCACLAGRQAWKMFNVFVCIVIAGILLGASLQVSYAQEGVENVEVYGVEGAAGEKDEGRSFLKCLEGWRQFTSAMVGYDPDNFDNYIKEIFFISWRSPAHFADIVNVEDQLNRARYAVMAAFLRCDLERLKSVTEAYYRLEAELYYIRNFVNTSGGYVEKRKNFGDKLADDLLILKAAEDKEKERAIYTGYFDLFEGKYAERAKIYADSSGDPIHAELKAKWDELMETFKSFQTLGSEMKNLGKDALAVGTGTAIAIGSTVAAPFQNPGKALKDLASNISNRFKACPSTGHPDECITFAEAIKTGIVTAAEGIAAGVTTAGKIIVGAGQAIGGTGVALYDAAVSLFSKGGKKTFEDIKKDTAFLETLTEEQAIKSKMLTRYELLYGQVSGEGVLALMSAMDELLKTLGPSAQGSLRPLEKAGLCAERVKNRVCSENF